MRDNAGKIDEGEKAKVESAIKNLKETITTDDKDKIQNAMTELSKASHKLTEMLYKKQAEQAPNTSNAGKTSENSTNEKASQKEAKNTEKEVKDADYEVVDENKGEK